LTLEHLKRRADFLRVAQGQSAATEGLVLQTAPAPAGAIERAQDTLRVGFTVTRKVGTAVARNRARRRLREAARLVLAQAGKPGHDYVLVGRRETLSRPFARLVADLEDALARVHARGAKGRSARPSRIEKRL
jgi:ribonuclease P protein component